MYIKFLNSNSTIECEVIPEGNVVTLKFSDKVVVNTSGFHAYLDKKCEYDISGDTYEKFVTIYRDDEFTAEFNGYQLSSDGSVYVDPPKTVSFVAGDDGSITGQERQEVMNYEELVVPEPVPNENYKFVQWEPDIPKSGTVKENRIFRAIFEFEKIYSLDEIKSMKLVEMNNEQQKTIQNGVEVTLSDGTVEHFTLTEHDQTSLIGLQTKVVAGDESIPWHTSDASEHCKYYSNADMAIITDTALNYVAYHVTYFRDLRIYINSLETKEEVEDIFYGVTIPEEYQSEPLKDMVAVMYA